MATKPKKTVEERLAEIEAAAEEIESAESGTHRIIDPRTIPVRFSNLKAMGQSPLHYWQAAQEDREESLAMRLGSGAHAMLFDQPLALFAGAVRNGEVWEAFAAKHAGKVILNRNEYEQSRGIVRAIKNHGLARELLFSSDSIIEQRIDWVFMGRKCRSTPDVLRRDCIADLKVTRSSQPDKFQRDGRWRAYHAQLAFYQDAVRHSRLGTPSDAYDVAVESTPPFAITVLRLTERAITQGRKLCRLWFERLLACEQANYWPPYVECVVDFDVEDDEEFRLRIGGEDVEV